MSGESTPQASSSRSAMPEPGKIHKLPVKIIYHLIPLPSPTSPSRQREQTFLTYPTASISVFIHPLPKTRNGKGRESDGIDDVWASVYLKAVVEGVCLASPELDPSFASPSSSKSFLTTSTLDHSLHILDPYQTHLHRLSNPATNEVWTGRGLFSTALMEPGEGKTMLKAKLVRDLHFDNDSRASDLGGESAEDEGGLEGLMRSAMAAQEQEEELEAAGGGWGVEIHLRMRAIDPVQLARVTPQSTSQLSLLSATRMPAESIRQRLRSTSSWDLAKGDDGLGKVVGGFDEAKLRNVVFGSSESGSSKVGASSRRSIEQAMKSEPTSTGDYEDSVCFEESAYPTSPLIAASSYTGQAAETPLESVNGSLPTVKKKRKKQPIKPGISCSNCGRVETVTWRMRGTERVCNACGIYWNKMKQMRPMELWGRPGKGDSLPPMKKNGNGGGVLSGKFVGGKWVKSTKAPIMTSTSDALGPSSPAARVSGQATAPAQSPLSVGGNGEFRRTLTTFVEKEAERLREKKGVGKGGVKKPIREIGGGRKQSMVRTPRQKLGRLAFNPNGGNQLMIETPVRYHPYATNPYPNAAAPVTPQIPLQGTPFDHLTMEQQRELLSSLEAALQTTRPTPDSPGTALRRLLAQSDGPGGMSMDLPLSDDSRGAIRSAERPIGGSTVAGVGAGGIEEMDVDLENLSAWFNLSQAQASQESQNGVESGGPGSGSTIEGAEQAGMDFKVVSEDLSDDPFAFFDANTPEHAATSSPFDFSQLPPSSPPIVYEDNAMGLGHPALLLSSPEDQLGMGSVSADGWTPWSDKATPMPHGGAGFFGGQGGDGAAQHRVGAGQLDALAGVGNMSEEDILAILAQHAA